MKFSCDRESHRSKVFCPHILGMLFRQILLFMFALAFYSGQMQTVISAEGPPLLCVSPS